MKTFHYLTLKINSLIHLELTLARRRIGGGGINGYVLYIQQNGNHKTDLLCGNINIFEQ
jgi:hypothetical protein